jgi:translocation and assembly module TamA
MKTSASACGLALLLGGVLTFALPAQAQHDGPAGASEPAPAGKNPASPAFRLEIVAPAPLDDFLLRHAELQRFSSFADLSQAELDRLLLTAPADLRQLLATQGHFAPSVEVKLIEGTDAPQTVRIKVEPGPLTHVADWRVELHGPAQADPAAAGQREAMLADWVLSEGRVFTQQDWDSSKQTALRTLNRQRYPLARIAHSLADIDPLQHEAHLLLELDSGPAYRFGPLRIEGSERYPPETIERLVRLAGVVPGQAYDEALLQEAQQRLLDQGDYESAFVRLDTDADPETAPVEVSVREARLQKILIGVGASTDNGARFSVEHLHRRLPWLDWRATTRMQLERDTRTLGAALDSPIDAQGWRWNVGAQLQRQDDGATVTHSQQLRAGRAQAGRRLERQFYAQYDRARVHDPALAVQADAASSLSAHYGWTRRDFDDLTNPSRGQGLAFELGAGLTLSQTRQPYLRSHLRWQGYRPAFEGSERPSRWSLRLEGGVVLSPDDGAVPATQRFLAGGEGSVRGYGLRDIGVERADGSVDPGRLLALASVEWRRPLWLEGRRSDWETALFIDAGAVADRSRDLSPKVGVGAGLRYRSPVGPLQLDLAYGLEQRALRLHMSVGFVF